MVLQQPSVRLTVISIIVLLSILKELECHSGSGRDHSNAAEGKPTLYLLALAPYPDPVFKPAWDGGPGLIPAARLAIEQVNNRSNILSDYNLKLIERQTDCNYFDAKALIAYTEEVFHSGKNIVGIIGPACSSAALKLGPLSGPDKAAMVQVTIGTSPDLTNRSQLPYTFSTLSSTYSYTATLLDLLSMQNWKQIVVLHDLNAYYISTLNALEDELERRNKSGVISFSSVLFDTYLPLTQIKDSDNRLILALVEPALARKLMCLAYQDEYRVLFPTYQWVFLDRTIDEAKDISFTYQGTSYSCSEEELKIAMEGSILLSYKLVTTTPDEPTVSELTYYEYEREYIKKVEEHERELRTMWPNYTISAQPYATAYHDAAWVMALALNNSVQPLKATGINLFDYQPGRKDVTEVIRQQLEGLDFNGVLGRINFDPTTGQPTSLIDLFQVKDKTMLPIGYFNTVSILSYYNGTFIEDSFQYMYSDIVITRAVFIVVLFVTAVQAIFAVCFQLINIVYSHAKPIRASSPALNHLIFSGYYLLVVSVIAYALVGFSPPSNGVIGGTICNSVLWSMDIGLTLILGTVCVKTWRIYRIFTHFNNPGNILLFDRALIIMVVILLLPTIIIGLGQILIAPVLIKETDVKISGDNNLLKIGIRVECDYSGTAI